MDRRMALGIVLCATLMTLAGMAFRAGWKDLGVEPEPHNTSASIVSEPEQVESDSAGLFTDGQRLTLITGESMIPLVVNGTSVEGQLGGERIRGTLNDDRTRLTWEQLDGEGRVVSHGTFTREAVH